MVSPPRHGLSLCAGGGGLDLGLGLAEPGFATSCYVEIEPDPRDVLIDAQRAGYMHPAPIWDDLRTFSGRPWRGLVDTVLAGYPCQPFSMAGQRRGVYDPRHLWPEVARIIRECEPEWCFLENVAGHLSLGLDAVLGELRGMGYSPAAGLFSAGETGAAHERQRVFIVAHRDERDDHGRGDRRAGRRPEPAIGSDDVVHPEGLGRAEGRAGAGLRVGRDAAVASAGGARTATWGPESDAGNGGQSNIVVHDCRPLHAPGPADADAWGAILDVAPDLAPALSVGDVAAVAGALSQMVAAGRMAQSAAQSLVRRMADGLAARSRALPILGNGVHPLAAANAWRALADAHGLRPVDFGAGRDGRGAADGADMTAAAQWGRAAGEGADG